MPQQVFASDAEARAFAEGRAQEQGDTLAYLARRRANAEKVASFSPSHADHAQAVIRECDIVSKYLAGGLHEGEVAVSTAAAIIATNPEDA